MKIRLHSSNSEWKISAIVASIVLMAIFHSAILAFLNANVQPLSLIHASFAELILLSAAGLCIIRSGVRTNYLRSVFLFFVFFLFLSAWNALVSVIYGNAPAIKPLRDVLILFLFLSLGYIYGKKYRASPTTLLVVASILNLTFLFVELLDTQLYVNLFDVSSFYVNTRGVGADMAESRLESGLFFTSHSYEGRFSFGLRSAQRLSSLFLEQTTHANFAVLLTLFCLSFWKHISAVSKFVILSTALLIILGTDSRQALGIILIFMAGYLILPMLPKYTIWAYFPLALSMLLGYYLAEGPLHVQRDDFSGRILYSATQVFSADFEALAGLSTSDRIVDSGYSYLIHAHSAIGLIALWILFPAMLPMDSSEARRFSHGIMIFFTVNLAVSGSTIFSMKTSSLLWFLVGCVAAKNSLRTEEPYKLGSARSGKPDTIIPSAILRS